MKRKRKHYKVKKYEMFSQIETCTYFNGKIVRIVTTDNPNYWPQVVVPILISGRNR